MLVSGHGLDNGLQEVTKVTCRLNSSSLESAPRKLVSRRGQIWIGIVAGLIVAQVLASIWLHQSYRLSLVTDIIQCILLIAALAFLTPNLASAKNRTPRTRGFWLLMMSGVGLWLSYQLLWTYFEVVLRQDVPDIFVGDIVLFLHLVPMTAALALEPETRQGERTSRVGMLDFVLLLVWWVFLYLFAVIPWQYAHIDQVAYSHNFNGLYLTEKIAFLGGLAFLSLRAKGPWRWTYLLWLFASALYALSSYVANWGIASHSYYTGSLFDIPLTVSMAALSIVGIASANLPLTEERSQDRTNHGVWSARWGMVAIFSLPLFAAWSIFDVSNPPSVRSFRLVLTLGAIMVMGGMVFMRQHLLDRELIRLLRASEDSFENLKRLQAQLVQSEKLASLGQLVGGAAHELNNPLTAMMGYADLLTATPLNDEQRALADKIGAQVRRTRALVASLLSFAKQMPSEKSRIDVNALCQTTVKLLQPQSRSRNVELQLELGTSLSPVTGDSNQLLQVCLHVVTNALQALDEVGGGTVKVSTFAIDGGVAFEVADSGPGALEPERVFDPFYTTRSVGQGVGLGLSACYGIVQEHKGRITCRNRAEGGACFRVELPTTKQMRNDTAMASAASR